MGKTEPKREEPLVELKTREAEEPHTSAGEYFEGRLAELSAELARISEALRRESAERRAAQEANRRLAAVIENCDEGVFSVDPNGVILGWNPGAARICGYEAGDVLGKNISILFSPQLDDFAGVVRRLAQEPRGGCEKAVLLHKNGAPLQVELIVCPIRDGHRGLLGVSCVVRDIADRLEAEARERSHRIQLVHAARMATLGEMAGGIAHELNQPLCAIASFGQACLRSLRSARLDPADIESAIQEMTNQALKAGEILRRLRRYVRREGPRETAVSINKLIREVANFTQREREERGVRLLLELSEDLPPVSADPIQIEQVLLNLVRNSLDALAGAGPGDRKLILRSALTENGRIEVAVSDSGPTILPEVLDRVFDPFFTTKPNGLGLGLSICRNIIEAHGGGLSAAVTADGTTFVFRLPTHSERRAAVALASRPPPPARAEVEAAKGRPPV